MAASDQTLGTNALCTYTTSTQTLDRNEGKEHVFEDLNGIRIREGPERMLWARTGIDEKADGT